MRATARAPSRGDAVARRRRVSGGSTDRGVIAQNSIGLLASLAGARARHRIAYDFNPPSRPVGSRGVARLRPGRSRRTTIRTGNEPRARTRERAEDERNHGFTDLGSQSMAGGHSSGSPVRVAPRRRPKWRHLVSGRRHRERQNDSFVRHLTSFTAYIYVVSRLTESNVDWPSVCLYIQVLLALASAECQGRSASIIQRR